MSNDVTAPYPILSGAWWCSTCGTEHRDGNPSPPYGCYKTAIDPLGFNYERMKRGEADIDAGLVWPLDEVMRMLRENLRRTEGES